MSSKEPKKITVEYDIDTVFRDYVYVRKLITDFCKCDVMEMAPVYAVNLDKKICAECNGIVTDTKESGYNQYYGYSGYDECE